jgi:dipeptidyl-peptidase-4
VVPCLNGILLLGVALALLAGGTSVPAQEAKSITVEWMYGKDPEAITALPEFAWLKDGSLLLYDVRRPESERTIEILNPASGVRRSALDMSKAITGLKALNGDTNNLAVLPWPVSLDEMGKRALYQFNGDLFVLDLAAAEFKRVTQGHSEEKAPMLSPDGKYAAFVRNNDLYVYNVSRGTEKRLTYTGSDSTLNGLFSWVYWEEIFGHREAAYWWSDNSKHIAYLHTDESPVSTMYFTDFQPYQPRIIRQRYPKAGERTPVVRVGIVDIEGGNNIWANLPPGYEYVTRVNWQPGGKRLSIQTMNRRQTEVALHSVDPLSGTSHTILKESDDAWLHIYDPCFMRNGKEFLWISDRSGHTHIYRYSTDGTMINQVTQGSWSIRPYGAFAIYENSAVASVDESDGLVYFTAGEKSTIERHLYRVRFNGNGMERLTHEDGYHRPTFSRDGKFYIDNFSSSSTPPALSLHRNDGTLVQTLAPARTELLKQLDLQFPRFLSIPTSDGVALPAQLSIPIGFNPTKKYPVIIYVYGGPASPSVSNAWNANGWSQSIYFDQILLRNGYLVISVDNRSSASISKTLEKSIRGQMYGDVELADLLSATKWIKQQPYVDPDRVGIWGWSGGGMYTLLALTRSTEFKAGISVAPVTDWHFYDAKWAELPMKLPEENPAGYERTSLVTRAADLHGRLLLVNGSYDDNVHPQNSQAFANGLIKAGKLFEMMVYPMRKHTIDDPPARIHLYNTMVEFWRRNL